VPVELDDHELRAATSGRTDTISNDSWAWATITSADRDEVLIAIVVPAGHLPTTARHELIEAVFAHPAVRASSRITATIPLGDFELLDGFSRHCPQVRTRAAGASCLVDAQR
jgi:hypothetical protein